VADFAAPVDPTTNHLVTIASSPRDPDPGDSIASYAWTVSRVGAACDADADDLGGPDLQLVFWCAGTYQVSLVVSDATGLSSAPVRKTIAVSQLAQAPTVTAGPAVAVEHRCGGSPPLCQLELPVALSAAAQSPAGGALTYQWTALPPDPSRAGATALFTPSDTAPAATLQLRTGGGAIAGAWTLRVRVRDPAGNLAQATQVVTVGNHEPRIEAAALALHHRYQDGLYQAEGALAVPLTDPDGDPVQASLQLVEPAGTGCGGGFTETAAGAGTLTLTCPQPSGLIGPARVIRVTATDVNGAAAVSDVPILIHNRLPVVRPAGGAGATELTVEHAVGPCPGGNGSCFQASGANPFVAVDPDGDPVAGITLLAGVEATRTASVGETGLGGTAGTFRFSTPLSRPSEFRAADGATGFRLTATASDPFGASAPAELRVRIGNRPPVVKVAVPDLATGHRWDAVARAYQAQATLATFEDPDGDPLVESGSVGDDACAQFSVGGGTVTASCSLPYTPAAGLPMLYAFAGVHHLVASAGDGWEVASSPTRVVIGNAPPEIPAYSGNVEGCLCHCDLWDVEPPRLCAVVPTWRADPQHAAFPVHALDADGDPLRVTFTSVASLSPTAITAAPELCTTAVSGATLSSTSYPVVVEVKAYDGLSQVSGTWTGINVVCPKRGQECTLP
jgi:PKD repeat protein